MNNHASVPVGVLGASGYVGHELLRLLRGHPATTIAFATAEPFRVVELGCRAAGDSEGRHRAYPVTPEGARYTEAQALGCPAGSGTLLVEFSTAPRDIGPVEGKTLVVAGDFAAERPYRVTLTPAAVADVQGRPLEMTGESELWVYFPRQPCYLGWSAAARRRNIRFLAYNTRFLILPWVRVEHLASHILGRMAARISDDWQRMYGHPIYFLETFVDPERFRGTCYRAANWVLLGKTTGRGKQSNSYVPNRSIKEVLGYPLTTQFRELLGE